MYQKNGPGHPLRFALSNSVTDLFAFVSPGVYIKVCFAYSGAAFVYIPFSNFAMDGWI